MLNVEAIFKAVIFAFVTGLAIGAMIGIAGFGLALSGVLTDDTIENSVVFHTFIYCLGRLPCVIGGYLVAAYAGRDMLIHGLAVGIALLGIEGLFYLFPDDDPFTLSDGVSLFLNIPLAATGSFIRAWQYNAR